MNFSGYLNALENNFRNKLKQLSSFYARLQQLGGLLTDLVAEHQQLNHQQWISEQQFNQLVSQLQWFYSPTEVWRWPTWKQMDLQMQIQQTKQLKQLVEKYVVVVQYLMMEEEMSEKLRYLPLDKSEQSNVFNPLEYASDPHIDYVSKYCGGKKKILFLGMNPGPNGMGQNGVPFGDPYTVSGWLGITSEGNPRILEELNRLITQKTCEESGKRFWKFCQQHSIDDEAFFSNCFVRNYCPLLFLKEEGSKHKNLALDSLRKELKEKIEGVCDEALAKSIDILGVEYVVAIGNYAYERAQHVINGYKFAKGDMLANGGMFANGCRFPKVIRIKHPSPATFLSEEDWMLLAAGQLGKEILGIDIADQIKPIFSEKESFSLC